MERNTNTTAEKAAKKNIDDMNLADLNAKDDAAPEVKDKIISERNGHATQGDFRVRRL